MGSVVNFADAVREAISVTQTEGNVIKVVADNGREIGKGVYEVIKGGNGQASGVTVMVKQVADTITKSGVAFLTVDLGIAGAAIAPALGVVAGVGLYNVSPSFWDAVGNTLYNAGCTIGGKVVAWWDGHNLYFDDTTIEAFKNALIDIDMFQYLSAVDDMTIDGVTYQPVPVSPLPWTAVQFVGEQGAAIQGIDPVEYSEPIHYWSYDPNDGYNVYQVYAVSKAPFTVNYWTRYGDSYNSTIHEGVEHSYNGQKFYVFFWSVSTTWDSTGVGYTYPLPQDGDINIVDYIVAYNGRPINFDNLQNGAKYPNDDEQFPLTYPWWYPFNYPDIDPTGLPKIYPLKYPEIDPVKYPDQKQAQDPEEENDEEVYPEILPKFPLPKPKIWDEPEEEEDPDPEEEDPDPIPEDKDPDPEEDPEDPNDDEDPTPVINDPDPPATVTSSKLFTVYNPSSANLNALGAYLWDSSLMASLRDIWQDPLDGVISLIQVFATPSTSGSQNIVLGYLDSGVSAPVVSSQFVTIDCGSVTVPESKENATDYAPYTSLHLFLPFIGVVELDTNECMKSTIKVVYQVDVYTGTCLAQVKVTRTKDMPNSPILYVFSGNCSQQIPLTSGNATGVLSALIGGITAGLSVASGGGLGVVAGAELLGNSLTHDMFHVSHSGNISANAGIMGNKKPYLIIGRRHGYDANNYNSFYGFPSNKTVILGNYTGFVRVKKCFIKTTATKPEHDEIMRLLRKGVIL